jgi:hypothetical protein
MLGHSDDVRSNAYGAASVNDRSHKQFVPSFQLRADCRGRMETAQGFADEITRNEVEGIAA